MSDQITDALLKQIARLEARIAHLEACDLPDSSLYVKKAGDTMTGLLTLSGDPTADLHAATKQYVDTDAKCRAYLNTAQNNIPNATWTKVNLDTTAYDPGSNFDTTNHKYVVPVAGYYVIVGQIYFTTASVVADKKYYAGLRKNGATIAYNISHSAVADSFACNVIDITHCAASDYIELYVYHGAGVDTIDLGTGDVVTYMAVHLLSRD